MVHLYCLRVDIQPINLMTLI